jgi:hypothetical protein
MPPSTSRSTSYVRARPAKCCGFAASLILPERTKSQSIDSSRTIASTLSTAASKSRYIARAFGSPKRRTSPS